MEDHSRSSEQCLSATSALLLCLLPLGLACGLLVTSYRALLHLLASSTVAAAAAGNGQWTNPLVAQERRRGAQPPPQGGARALGDPRPLIGRTSCSRREPKVGFPISVTHHSGAPERHQNIERRSGKCKNVVLYTHTAPRYLSAVRMHGILLAYCGAGNNRTYTA